MAVLLQLDCATTARPSLPPPSPTFYLHLCVCVLLCFIQPVLGNRYVRSRGFIMCEPREKHPRSEIADVPTSPCPP